MDREHRNIVWDEDRSSDSIHSMASKDHFSDILNEPVGQMESYMFTWMPLQVLECWDDEMIDPQQVLSSIFDGVFHHPAPRGHGEDDAVDGRRGMFSMVQLLGNQKDDDKRSFMRDQLSNQVVQTRSKAQKGNP